MVWVYGKNVSGETKRGYDKQRGFREEQEAGEEKSRTCDGV